MNVTDVLKVTDSYTCINMECDLSDFKPFEYQVAGHDAKSITGSVGILKHKEGGYILKPINKSPQGDVEIAFYERLRNDKDLLPLREFIPNYLGFLCLKVTDSDVRFLKLEDVTNGFSKPCVMDVKIGKQTWDPSASLHKRATEEAKYVESKKEFGFCIPGYFVFNIATSQLEKVGKETGKHLNKETTINAFKHFFNHPHSSIIIKKTIERLSELLAWWNIQQIIHLYSSSVLLTYDARHLEEIINGKIIHQDNDVGKWVKVYMIDFAHVFPANNTKDWNYFLGLSKLIEILKMLI